MEYITSVTFRKNYEAYTPRYAVEIILPYIKPASTIWCPFDKDYSEFVQVFRGKGFNVINTHIDDGGDFFKVEVPECDYIISNPPYSNKRAVLRRLNDIGKPYAMFLPITMLNDNYGKELEGIELLIPNKRAEFKRIGKASGIPFKCAYSCKGMLDKQIVFCEMKRIKEQEIIQDYELEDIKNTSASGIRQVQLFEF